MSNGSSKRTKGREERRIMKTRGEEQKKGQTRVNQQLVIPTTSGFPHSTGLVLHNPRRIKNLPQKERKTVREERN